jgi:hypothetical protein
VDRGDPGGVGKDEGDGVQMTENRGQRTDKNTLSLLRQAQDRPSLSHQGRGGIPAVLVRQGVCSVSDNLFPGDTLNVGRIFMNMFRTELEARLIKPCADKNRSPCPLGK